MPTHRETQILPYTPAQLFAMVVDVERYAEFLPWCLASRVRDRGADHFIGELVIGAKGMRESYTSRVTFAAPSAIDVVMERGPFTHLVNEWRFTPVEEGTRVDFLLDFAFRSKMLDRLMGRFFTEATQKMVAAFTQRAAALYR